MRGGVVSVNIPSMISLEYFLFIFCMSKYSSVDSEVDSEKLR